MTNQSRHDLAIAVMVLENVHEALASVISVLHGDADLVGARRLVWGSWQKQKRNLERELWIEQQAAHERGDS